MVKQVNTNLEEESECTLNPLVNQSVNEQDKSALSIKASFDPEASLLVPGVGCCG